jgi:hypothetical protein
MSQYYKGKRTRNIYDPLQHEPFKLSRSRIDLFLSCPRCFYIDRRLGVDRPPGFPFAINSAVDSLLKNEFDTLRYAGETHPLIKKFGIDARPVAHDMLNEWRENFKGVQYHDAKTNFIITGAIDDLWIDSHGAYIVVDYKSTAKSEPVTELGDGGHYDAYRRQMEVYQWLLRKNGLTVSNTGYFVYCTGQPDNERFDAHVQFDMRVIPYTGNDAWVEDTLRNIKNTLDSDIIPNASNECDYCLYVHDRANAELT